jgi:hypothetical protein
VPVASGGPGSSSEQPVFVDPSGRRAQRARRAVRILAVPAAGYVIALVSSIAGGPSLPAVLIPGQAQDQGSVAYADVDDYVAGGPTDEFLGGVRFPTDSPPGAPLPGDRSALPAGPSTTVVDVDTETGAETDTETDTEAGSQPNLRRAEPGSPRSAAAAPADAAAGGQARSDEQSRAGRGGAGADAGPRGGHTSGTKPTVEPPATGKARANSPDA